MKMTAATIDEADQDHEDEGRPSLLLLDAPHGAGERRGDLAEDQDRHAVADATVGDELAEPHDDGGAGDHGQNDQQERPDAVVVVEQRLAGVSATEEVAAAGQRHDAGRLQDREAQREVAGVLRDLGLSGLTLLLEGLQTRDHHDEQLQDDARGDVGHDAQREHRQLQQCAAGEDVDEREQAAVLTAGRRRDGVLDVGDVDAGGRGRRAQSEQDDDEEDEEKLLPQVRRPERVDEGAEHREPPRAPECVCNGQKRAFARAENSNSEENRRSRTGVPLRRSSAEDGDAAAGCFDLGLGRSGELVRRDLEP